MPGLISSPRRRSFSGTDLKALACLTMFIDHIGASCLESGVLSFVYPGSAVFWRVYCVDFVLRAIGRIAFPIYCFLLAEGFCHTRNRLRYALRLLAFAFFSEVFFDLAFFHTAFYWQYQNVYFTLFLGLCAIWCAAKTPGSGLAQFALQCLAVAPFAITAQLLRADYGAMGVALIAAFYLFRGNDTLRDIALFVLTLRDLPAAVAVAPLRCYNGQRGKCPRWAQYGFYLFYPAHLAILAFITYTFLSA